MTIYMRRYLVVFVFLGMYWCHSALFAQGRPQQRSRTQDSFQNVARQTLPLRGEQLLERLLLAPPLIVPKAISVSPDGSKALYVETSAHPDAMARSDLESLARGYFSIFGSDNKAVVTSKIWLLDLATGRRFPLPSYERDLESTVADRYLIPQWQWSHDGQEAALLEQRDDEVLTLVVARTDRPAPVRKIQLANSEVLQHQILRNWLWISERGEILLGLEPKPSKHAKEWGGPRGDWQAAVKQSDNEFAWFESWFKPAKEASARQFILNSGGGPLRLWLSNTKNRSTREIEYQSHRIFASSNSYHSWRLTPNRCDVLISSRDPGLAENAIQVAYQSMLIDRGDLGNNELAKAHSTLYALDTESWNLRALYAGNFGRIATPIELLDGKIIGLEEDRTLATWPVEARWGRVHHLRSHFKKGAPAANPVPLTSKLYAGDRANTAYLHEVGPGVVQRLAAQRLGEIDLASGVWTTISPAGFNATWVDVSADGKTVVAVLENVNAPPEIYAWTADGRRWRKLTGYGTGFRLDDFGVAPVEHLTWRSKDDRFDIDGFLVKPRDFDPANTYPLLVFLNGGWPGGTIAFRNSFSQGGLGIGGALAHVFAAEGYLVLLANHRDVEYYGTAGAAKSNVGHFGRHYDYDVDAGVNYLIAKGLVDQDKLGIMGHSDGSNEVAYAISHTNRYKAAVVNDGFFMLLLESVELGFPLPPSAAKSTEAISALVGFDPIEKPWADPFKIRTPLLMRYVSDRRDERAGKLMYYALSRNNIPVDILYDRDGHSVESSKYMVEFQSRVLQWFDYFVLGKGSNPIPAMKSPLDYTEELEAKGTIHGRTDPGPAASTAGDRRREGIGQRRMTLVPDGELLPTTPGPDVPPGIENDDGAQGR